MARKSGAKTSSGVLTLACAKIAVKMLPLVWLKIHVKMSASAITNRKNMEKFVRKVSKPVPGPPPLSGVRKRGKCQKVHRTPRSRVPPSGP